MHFFDFFLRLDQGTAGCSTGEQLYWLRRRPWQMSGCQDPLSPGRRVQDDPDSQLSQARSRTIVLVTPRGGCSCPGLGSPVQNNCTGYTPSELRIPRGGAAQSRTIILALGVPITWNPDNPNNLVQTPVLSTPTTRTISIKVRGRSPIPPR